MNISEMSALFDVLYSNITSNQAPGINEFEKSVFLTKAQSQLVNEFFNNRTDGFGGGYDGSQRRQYDFSGLIRTENLFKVNAFNERITANEKLDRRSIVYLFPQNYFLAVSEILWDTKQQYSVMPLSYPEYQRLMSKPYNFPPKREAWRLFTDKKNCNVWEATIDKNGEFYEPNSPEYPASEIELTGTTYSFQSSWADKKRNLAITIRMHDQSAWESSMASDTFTIDDDVMSFKVNNNFFGEGKTIYAVVQADCGWESDGLTYKVDLTIWSNLETDSPDDADDEAAIEILKNGFSQLKAEGYNPDSSSELVKAAKHTDGFLMCSAPSKFYKFRTTENQVLVGYTFTTHVEALPMAEIIGKFTGIPEYQLRYVRNLTPIILEDLTNYGDDLSIDGITAATECKLPKETHQEIVERAVTLAKIAWQGGTVTQAQASQKSRNED